jgi:hypothetical protein
VNFRRKPIFVSAKVFDIFSMAGRYSAGEGPLIKAGQLEAVPHLTTACIEGNTIIREK